jgi:hypothetical protein
MEKKSNHVIPISSRWVVRKTGASRASKVFTTKENAIQYGTKLSRNEKTELYIHKKNGMIQYRNSFAE